MRGGLSTALAIFASFGWGLPSSAWGAACCGGGAAFPNLILGDFRSQVSLSAGYGDVIGEASASGQSVFRRAGNLELTDTYRLDAAYLLGEFWQVSVSGTVLGRSRELDGARASSRGMGDSAVSVAYEILPVLYYSAWKPRGFLYARLGLPTGPSAYEARENFAVDARVSGFVSVSLGAALVKNAGSLDFELLGEATQRLPRDFETSSGAVAVRPHPSASLMAGAGYTPDSMPKLRLGASLSPRFTGRKDTRGAVVSSSSHELVWDTVASMNYLFETELSAGLSYLDQTLFGPARATTLQRSVSLTVQKRWSL